MKALPPEGAWFSKPAIIVGGGPSLRDFWWEVLRDVPRVVAINLAYQKVPTADVFFTEDHRVIAKFGLQDDFRFFQGSKVVHVLEDAYMTELAPFLDDLTLIRKKRNDKFWAAHLDEGLSVSSNSAIGAINLAEILGARTIYLLGMDCTKDGKDVNFHDQYPEEWRAGRHQLDSFASDWKHWVKPKCKARIVNVINPKLPSKIDCFPVLTFEGFYDSLHHNLLHCELSGSRQGTGEVRT